jgi:hypothetical protein
MNPVMVEYQVHSSSETPCVHINSIRLLYLGNVAGISTKVNKHFYETLNCILDRQYKIQHAYIKKTHTHIQSLE